MGIEIEKKYRLTRRQREMVLKRLAKVGAELVTTELEENTLYAGCNLDSGHSVLRLRRVGGRAILTYKERFPSTSDIRHQQEDETEIGDAEALDAILQGLGFEPALIYEKRRMTWKVGGAEVDVDDLPFGLFMEIEASEAEILAVERRLKLEELKAESSTYPALAFKHGKRSGRLVEARFGTTKANRS